LLRRTRRREHRTGWPSRLRAGWSLWSLWPAGRGRPTWQRIRRRPGTIGRTTVGNNTVRTGTMRSHAVRTATVRSNTVRTGTVRTGTVRTGTVRTGTVRTGALRSSAAEDCAVRRSTICVSTAEDSTPRPSGRNAAGPGSRCTWLLRQLSDRLRGSLARPLRHDRPDRLDRPERRQPLIRIGIRIAIARARRRPARLAPAPLVEILAVSVRLVLAWLAPTSTCPGHC
jgi:hypothetical protein